MKVTILGNNSALPAYERHPTSQIVSVNGDDIMIDCGEGSQIQMQRYGMKWRKLNHILISHLHGDHYFGLPGLLNSMSLLGRTTELHLYAPKSLEEIIAKILSVADTILCYPLHFHPLHENESEVLADNKHFSITSFPVEHRIACHGFVIEEKTKGRKLLPEKCREYEIPAYFYDRLKKSEDYIKSDGFVVKNEWVTDDAPLPKRYAYCADTTFTASFMKFVKDADCIYHEATYLDAEAEKAKMRFHSTSKQAAEIAKLANAKQLLLGHFSSKYQDLQLFLNEASSVFPNVIVTKEGESYEV